MRQTVSCFDFSLRLSLSLSLLLSLPPPPVLFHLRRSSFCTSSTAHTQTNQQQKTNFASASIRIFSLSLPWQISSASFASQNAQWKTKTANANQLTKIGPVQNVPSPNI